MSYLLGDDKTGTAAVIDPRADVEVYIDLAQRKKLAITHIFETHIHADLVSGARELSARVETAKIFLSTEGGAEYGFAHEGIHDGAPFEFGELLLTARHTPGHTPEHMSFIAADKKHARTPWGVFTGDSLFVNSAGRPDLMGEDQTEHLAEELFQTLYMFYLNLEAGTVIYPAHGKGSPCGADIGDRLTSTIGYEQQFNPFLQYPDKNAFKEYVLSSAPPEPTYYKRMKRMNAQGPEVLGNLPIVPGLPPETFHKAMKRNTKVIDTRAMLAFGGGHIEEALNIGGLPELSLWAGWILDPDQPLLLVLEHDEDLGKIVPLFVRTGYTKFAGYLVGGMKAWNNAGLRLEEIPQVTVHEIQEDAENIQILDVRSPDEWKKGHIPGAQHIFLPEIPEKAEGLSKQKPFAVYCDSGYRASIAASLLHSMGFDVYNVPGSWQAWLSAGYPIENNVEGLS
ncbi:MAG TPA: MBL fold metallo-hydrolase [Alphaproteobacteria bacterium]|nr:MBL fold metallo-hydrolase [Alphaproteobacteria bacterium]